MNRTSNTLFATFTIIFAMVMSGSLFAQDHIAWRYDLEQAKKVASDENKPILLHFSASWCAPCKEIERFVFVNPMSIRAIGGQVVPVKVDVDLHTHIAEEYGVTTVPYDVIITAAGHVISERSSPRSSDGYLQMIEQAKSGAANIPENVLKETAELRDEIRRQQQTQTELQQKQQSYGALAETDTNQFKSTHEAPQGFDVPKFQYPKPWSDTNVVAHAPAGKDGVIENKFVAPSGDFKPKLPAVKTPKIESPDMPQSPAAGGQFVPPQQIAKTNTRVFERSQPVESAADSTLPGTQGDFAPETKTANSMIDNAVAGNSVAQAAPQPTRIINPMAQTKTDPVALQTPATPVKAAAAEPPRGLDGYCSVTLMEKQKWVKGDKQWGCFHRGRLYLFASREYRDRFQMSPDMYSPLLGGADPVNYHEKGNLVDGMRKHGVFYGEDDGPSVIVLFSNSDNRARFESDPSEYLRTVRQAMSRVDSDLLLR